MEFRRSKPEDAEQMAAIAEQGKKLLKSKGISQWQRGTYPDKALFLRDAENGIGYVLAEGEEVLAVCAVTFTDEAAYRNPTGGGWLTGPEACYATIHRGAVKGERQEKNLSGVLFSEAAKLAKNRGAVSLRADTHPDNLTMQKAMERAGFVRCCTLILEEGDEAGDPRLGYEMVL